MAGGGFALSKQILVNNRDIIKEQQQRELYNMKLQEYAQRQQDKDKFQAHPFANNVSQRYRDVLQTAINDSQNWWKENYKDAKTNPDIATEWENRKQSIKTLSSDLNAASTRLKTLEDFLNENGSDAMNAQLKADDSGNFEWLKQVDANVSGTNIQYINGQYMSVSSDQEGNVQYNPINKTYGFDFSEANILKDVGNIDVNGGLDGLLDGASILQFKEDGTGYTSKSIRASKDFFAEQLRPNENGTFKNDAAKIKRDALLEDYMTTSANQDTDSWKDSDWEKFYDWGGNKIWEDTSSYRLSSKDVKDKTKKGLDIDNLQSYTESKVITKSIVPFENGNTYYKPEGSGYKPNYLKKDFYYSEKIPFKEAKSFYFDNGEGTQAWKVQELVKSDDGNWYAVAFNAPNLSIPGGKAEAYQTDLIPLEEIAYRLGINLIDGNPEGYTPKEVKTPDLDNNSTSIGPESPGDAYFGNK